MTIRIAHIADIHISPDGSFVRDIDVRKQFMEVLYSISNYRPDLLIFGGDLAAEDGEVEAYQWIKKQLEEFAGPSLIIPGNHDRIPQLVSVFGSQAIKPSGLSFEFSSGNYLLVGLDSSKGIVDSDQLNHLQAAAKKWQGPVLLFIHHPPIDCHCVFMDSRYPLANREQVFEVLNQIPNIKHIFCGHYHTEKTIIANNKIVYITPSTMLQINQLNPHFEVESTIPCWRLIEIENEIMFTSVVRPG